MLKLTLILILYGCMEPTSTRTGVIPKISGAAIFEPSALSDDNQTVTSILPLEINQSPANAFTVSSRLSPTTIPVVTFRPVAMDSNLALDLMPRGHPLETSSGFTWAHYCDRDLLEDPTQAVRCAYSGVTSTYVKIGSTHFNGATTLPLALIVGDSAAVVVNERAPVIFANAAAFTPERVSAGSATPAVGTTMISGVGVVSLQDGTVDGQLKTFVVTSGSGTITPAHGTAFSYSTAPASLMLMWDILGGRWVVVTSSGMTEIP